MSKKAKAPKVSTIQEVRKDIDPQLAKVFNPAKHKWEHSWIAEPKFDGLRCIVVIEYAKGSQLVQAFSRNGKPLWNMDKILDEISCHAPWGQPLILDGEVYTKDWNLSMSIVKRSTQPHPDQDKLRYHVWDCLTAEEWKARRSDVFNTVRKERLCFLEGATYFELVEGVVVNNQEELQHAYATFLHQGYEGAILKNPRGPYECGRRSPSWLKIKPWTDADLTVVGAYAGEGKHIGRIGGLVLEGRVEWNGKEFDIRTECGTGFSDEEREFFQKLWETNKLQGRIVEIKFQDITVDGACRFPVYNRLREDKE